VTVTELTRPALVELLLQGMSEAAQALTEMSGRLIRVETIGAYLCAPADLGQFVDGNERSVVVAMDVTGPPSAHAAMVVGLLDARRLGTVLLADLPDEVPGDPDGLGPLQASAISEVANVTIGTLVRCLERATGASLRASVPRLTIGAAAGALRGLAPAGTHDSHEAVVTITSFADATREIRGTLLVIPDHASFVTLRAMLGGW
jgi:chemotaxis protein CheY-P-specific phosphatase CheC